MFTLDKANDNGEEPHFGVGKTEFLDGEAEFLSDIPAEGAGTSTFRGGEIEKAAPMLALPSFTVKYGFGS
jgi:hypothetical protein